MTGLKDGSVSYTPEERAQERALAAEVERIAKAVLMAILRRDPRYNREP